MAVRFTRAGLDEHSTGIIDQIAFDISFEQSFLTTSNPGSVAESRAESCCYD